MKDHEVFQTTTVDEFHLPFHKVEGKLWLKQRDKLAARGHRGGLSRVGLVDNSLSYFVEKQPHLLMANC